VNAELVVSQWLLHTIAFFLCLPVNAELKAGQGKSAIFQIFVMIQPGIKSSL